MTFWQFHFVPFKFQLSDWTLFNITVPLQVRIVKLSDAAHIESTPTPPLDSLSPNSQGFAIRSMPIATRCPAIRFINSYICYTPLKYQHYYIDFNLSFDEYQKKFSSKTRATINRKVKKYTEFCGGTIPWKTYKVPDEMQEFFQYSRQISKKTYQEKLLDAGIPDSQEFFDHMMALASQGLVRGYILFDSERPVSYLYCPIQDNVLIYAYLGYDPDYMKMSVGTVLQWLAIEELFEEGCFKFFDFTEGQSEHKRLFATHSSLRANVFFIKRNLRNALLIYSHYGVGRLSQFIGNILDRMGLKARIRRILRFR